MAYILNATDADCYEGTTVLINKLGIRYEDELNSHERLITGFKSAELLSIPLKADFDFNDYKMIHRELFSELYEWAGIVRTIPLSKGATVFTAPEKIENMGKAVFGRLTITLYQKRLRARFSFVRHHMALHSLLSHSSAVIGTVYFKAIEKPVNIWYNNCNKNSEVKYGNKIITSRHITDQWY